MRLPILIACIVISATASTHAQTSFTVHRQRLTDEKAVFATVESPNVVPARTRIAGTIASLSTRQGDAVTQGQVIAVVTDEKLALQVNALDAQIAGLQSQLAQANTDLARAETLFRQGAGPRTTLDQARTAVQVATSALRARIEQRAVAQQNLQQGEVLAPVSGRVLTVPFTKGTVVMNGDTVATIGEEPFLLRLQVPERNAISLKVGDPIRFDPGQLGLTPDATGKITLVYPEIAQGRVQADAAVTGLGNYFVGDRVRVWINAGSREGFVVPEDFVVTHFGLDYVKLHQPDGGTVQTPVQRGEARPTPALPNGLEILSGVHNGDVLVQP